VHAAYRVENQGTGSLPFLWSIHPLLALDPGSTVELDRAAEVRITTAVGFDTPPERRLDRSIVNGIAAGTALKAYARMEAPGTALARRPSGATLRFTWDVAVLPVAGLWLDFGGWPADAPVHQVAIEPTTSEDDDLRSAIEAGRALMVGSGQAAVWNVRMSLD
ncbi:MAG: hypothetical protein QOF49_1658, partial [Chloroflexota bacterium]|nr:hypothetical protein [Chloroflexota bacterium]